MAEKIIHIDNDIRSLIDMGVDKTHLSVRDGRAGAKYYYVKQGVLTEYLNQTFGPLGWDMQVGEPKIERTEEKRARRNDAITVNSIEVFIKVTLRIKSNMAGSSDTIFEHYGIGTGEAEVGKSAKEALGMAIKGAESDGFKRCAAHLGKRFGLLLTQQGTQNLIDYAQANNDNRRREMKRAAESESKPRERSNESRGTAGHERERAEKADDRQTSSGRGSDPAPRQERERAESRNSERDRKEPVPAADKKEDQRSVRDERKVEKERAEETPERSEDRPVEKAPSGKKPPEVSDQYDLEILPMTRPEQASFAKTLLRVVGETDEKDQEALIKQHYNVVKDLEGAVKKHFIAMLNDNYGIDFNAIRS